KLPRDWPIISGVDGRGLHYDGEILECQTAMPVKEGELEPSEKQLAMLIAQMQNAAMHNGYRNPESTEELPDVYHLDRSMPQDIFDSWQEFKSVSPANSSPPLKILLGLDDYDLKPIHIER